MNRLSFLLSTSELVSRISLNPAATIVSTSSRVWQAIPAAPAETCIRPSAGTRCTLMCGRRLILLSPSLRCIAMVLASKVSIITIVNGVERVSGVKPEIRSPYLDPCGWGWSSWGPQPSQNPRNAKWWGLVWKPYL